MKRRSFLLTSPGGIAAISGAYSCTDEKKEALKKQPAGNTQTSNKIRLRGVIWNTTRGYLPLLATAQRYEELHPGVEIVWDKGYDFAQGNLEIVSQSYDVLMIDHPHVGMPRQKVF